nr:GPW/gp25 family protein [Gluconobacter thailandicus]
MDRQTGKVLQGANHLLQSITDILTTPIGTRVMRRDYGSRLFELIDSAMNKSGVMDIYAATVEALAKWEPRISITKVNVIPGVGGMTIDLSAVDKETGNNLTITGIQIAR